MVVLSVLEAASGRPLMTVAGEGTDEPADPRRLGSKSANSPCSSTLRPLADAAAVYVATSRSREPFGIRAEKASWSASGTAGGDPCEERVLPFVLDSAASRSSPACAESEASFGGSEDECGMAWVLSRAEWSITSEEGDREGLPSPMFADMLIQRCDQSMDEVLHCCEQASRHSLGRACLFYASLCPDVRMVTGLCRAFFDRRQSRYRVSKTGDDVWAG